MGIRVIASSDIKVGYVRVLEDGIVVADGPLQRCAWTTTSRSPNASRLREYGRRHGPDAAVRRREAQLIEFLRNLLGRAPVDRIVIDQEGARREGERRRDANAAFGRSLEAEQRRVAMLTGAWARETMTLRRRAPMNAKLRTAVIEWLPGLVLSEIVILAKAPRDDVRRHIFRSDLIEGLRPMRPLVPTALIFPAAVAPAEDHRERVGGGGGPRKGPK
ncbi:MAG TPA: hypothetical protein VG222_14000 [Vicinamibacterales bacterium]|jgi:hypothetical protein|nr:hypothetical protein [Vicinamibacterales bacterium]